MKKVFSFLLLVLFGFVVIPECANAAQRIEFSDIDVSIDFPNSFSIIYRTMNEQEAIERGMTKDSIIADLDARRSECAAVNSSLDILFEVGRPSLDHLDFEELTSRSRNQIVEMYKAEYEENGWIIEDICFIDMPSTVCLRIRGNVPFSGGKRHLIQYHFTHQDHSFFLQAATETHSFSEEELLMCEAIAKTICLEKEGVSKIEESNDIFTLVESGIEFIVPTLWYQSKTITNDAVTSVFAPFDGKGLADISYDYMDLYEIMIENGEISIPRDKVVSEFFNMTSKEFAEWSINSITSVYTDPSKALIYTIELGNYEYVVSEFSHVWDQQEEKYIYPGIIVLRVDEDAAFTHWFTYTGCGNEIDKEYIADLIDMVSSAKYPMDQVSLTEASELVRTSYMFSPFDENGISIITDSNLKDGMISRDGRIIAKPKWERISYCRDGLYLAVGENENCYIKSDGSLLTGERWNNLSDFHEGLARIGGKTEAGYRYGYIDSNGEIRIDIQYGSAGYFSEGLADVRSDNGCVGYINQRGEMVIEPIWDYGYGFQNGFAIVFKGKTNIIGLPSKGLYGVIDKQGYVISEPQWDNIEAYSDDLALVEKSGKYGYIDKRGNVVIEPQWENALSFSCGLARVRGKNGKYGFIDHSGKLIIDCEWDYATVFQDNGYARVFRGTLQGNGSPENGCYGMINIRGEVVIEPYWDNAFNYMGGYASVQKNGVYGLIDERGEVIIPLEWDDLSKPYEGLLRATKDGKVGFIDIRGNTVIDFEWDEASVFNNGLAYVKKNGQWYVIDMWGNVVI